MNDRPDLHTLTGAYAVDALPDDERRRFEAHLAVCDACAQEIEELQATASRLGATMVAAPPPQLRARVLAEIDTIRQDPPTRSRDEAAVVELASRRRTPGWITAGLGVAAAVLLMVVAGLGAVVVELRSQVGELEVAAVGAEQAGAQLAALTDRLEELEAREDEVILTTSAVADVLAAADAVTVMVEHDEVVGRVVASPTRGEAVFVADGWEPAPHEHTYELWLISDEQAVPAGLFDPDERGRATRVLTGDMSSARAVGVTIEPEGGSPTPSDEPIMVLELS